MQFSFGNESKLKQLILGDSTLHADISVICYFNLEDVTYKN